MPKVDIIVPAYNAATYLTAALESVLEQTYSDWRILLVDDGSTDRTAEIAREFAQKCGRKMKIISQENSGLSAARNAALREASAEFIALLDADDIWLPGRLEKSVASVEGKSGIGLSYGSITYIDQQGMTQGTPLLETRDAEGWIARGIYTRELNLPCPTILFRRECIEKVGFFDETLRAAEDRDLWLRIALQYQVARIPDVIALYRISSGSMSTDFNRMLEAQRIFIAKHFGASGCDAQARRLALSSSHRELAQTLAVRGHRTQALNSIAKAILLHPRDARNWRNGVAILADLLLVRRYR
jgi:glycosyltransferase involved in cell wall biosynthesis